MLGFESICFTFSEIKDIVEWGKKCQFSDISTVVVFDLEIRGTYRILLEGTHIYLTYTNAGHMGTMRVAH